MTAQLFKNHVLQGFVSDLMYPQSYGAICSCGWDSRWIDPTIDEARLRWASHVFEQETQE